MKRLWIVVMVLAMLFGAVTAVMADAVAGKTIGFVNAGPDDYYAQFGKTLVAIGKSYGMNVVEVNSNYKPEKELANVQDLIAKGVDAIAVITAGAAGSAKSVEAANHAKVPIFFIAGKPDVMPGNAFQGHVTDNFVIMGYKIGKWVAKNYPGAKCAEIPGFLGQGPAEGEIVGFQLALDEANMGKAIMLKSADWQRTKAIPVTEDLLASGRPFDVMFAANEETAGGVIQVSRSRTSRARSSSRQWQRGCLAVDEGRLDVGDGSQSSFAECGPVRPADRAVPEGEKFIADLQITPWDVLTKENLDKAIPWNTAAYMKGRAENKFEWHLDYYEKQFQANKKMFDDFDAKLKAYMASH